MSENVANNCTLAGNGEPTTDCNEVLTNSKNNINKVVFEEACCYQITVVNNLNEMSPADFKKNNIQEALDVYSKNGIPTSLESTKAKGKENEEKVK